MDGLERLRAERQRLLGEITRLSTTVGPYPSPRAEDLWRRLRAASTTYRVSMLPHLRALEEVLGTAITDLDADDHTMVALTLVRDEIEHELNDLTAVEHEVLEEGLTAKRLLAATRALAGLRVLAIVGLRLTDEVIVPRLEQVMTPHEVDSVADAMFAYEQSLGEAS